MAHSLAQVHLHIVFSTKDRQPFLQNGGLRQEMHAYLVGACRSLDSPSLIVGGVADHVHILCSLSRTRSMADLLYHLKRQSSRWIKTREYSLQQFYWQQGYGAFSASPGQIEALRRYIANQEEHHRVETFQDEYRRLLWEHDIGFDERYIWE